LTIIGLIIRFAFHLFAITVDQKLAVLSAVVCGDVTTSKQSKPDAELKTIVSA
jgi:hypothetical protein